MINRTKSLILFFCFLFLPPEVLALDADSIVQRFQVKYEKVSTLAAGFVQETYIRSLDRWEVSRGKVYFKKPGKMRWDYMEPEKDQVVTDGTTLWIYEPDLAQVIEIPALTGTATIAMDFLTGTGRLAEDFSVELVEDKTTTYLLGLEPREPLEGVKKISIEVDKQSYLVVKSVIEDHFGGETSVSLSGIELNKTLSDTLFEFSVPEGVRVLRP